MNINLDENLHIPSISALNNARRTAINMLQEKIMNKFLEKRSDVTSNQTENITTLNSKNTNNKFSNEKLFSENDLIALYMNKICIRKY